MPRKALWNSPRLPSFITENEETLWLLRAKAGELANDDSPSLSDLATLIHKYNEASRFERDAIDAAFVWLTGYTFATICAMVVTPKGKDYERTLEKWRKGQS